MRASERPEHIYLSRHEVFTASNQVSYLSRHCITRYLVPGVGGPGVGDIGGRQQCPGDRHVLAVAVLPRTHRNQVERGRAQVAGL